MTIDKNDLKASREQIIYANILIIGVWSGLFILFLTYAIYVFGLMPPHIEISRIPLLWGENVHEFLEATHSPHGWGWVHLLGTGDFLNYIGFVLLALMTIFCYMVLVKGYIRQKSWLFATIAILEILVLAVAASGLLGSGGH